MWIYNWKGFYSLFDPLKLKPASDVANCNMPIVCNCKYGPTYMAWGWPTRVAALVPHCRRSTPHQRRLGGRGTGYDKCSYYYYYYDDEFTM